jgi:hypothetical protein
VGNDGFGAAYYVQLAVFGYPEPGMAVIVKRLGYLFELHYFFVELTGFLQVHHENGLVAEAGAAGGSCLCHSGICGYYNDSQACYKTGQKFPFHRQRAFKS